MPVGAISMKKGRIGLLAGLLLFLLCSCSRPDSMQMEVYMASGAQLKLLQINASSQDRITQMEGVEAAILDAEPTDKTLSQFAFYPEYRIVITRAEEAPITVILDVNENFVEFYDPADDEGVIYRSNMSAVDFNIYLHQ